MGFSDHFALQALHQGWTTDSIMALHSWCIFQNLPVTFVFKGLVVLDSWFIVSSQNIQETEISYQIARDFYLKNRPDPLDFWALEIQAYCDGSGTTAQDKAGAGVVVLFPNKERRLIARHLGLGSNNFAELSAILVSLLEIPDLTAKIVINSDSQYAIGAVTQNWNRAYNADLIQRVRDNLELRIDQFGVSNVTFKHVPGHAGVLWNEIADRLAKAGRTQAPVEISAKLQKAMADS